MDVVVFTGELSKWTRKEEAAATEAKGYAVGASVTKATTILVYGSKAGKKVEDAKKKGVTLYSEDKWAAKLDEGDGDQEMAEADDDDEDMEEEDEDVEKKDDVVVFTGELTQMTRKEAAAQAEAKGYTVGSSVTKATTILVCGEKAGKKMKDAKKKGIKIFTESEWATHLGAGTSTSDKTEKKKAKVAPAKAKEPKTATKRKAETTSDPTQDVVVFTGRLVNHSRKEATSLAEAKGFRVEPRVTKATTILVCGDDSGQKMDAAKKQGITIYTEDEWQEKVDAIDGGAASPPLAKKQATKPVAVSDGEVEFDSETAAINGVLPKTVIPDGTIVDVKSASSNSTYLIKRVGSSYTCSCPAWRNQRHAPTSRTCKHLKEALGEEYEALRASGSASAPRGPSKAGSSTGSKAAVVKASAPDVLLAKKWEREKNSPVGWWISEKLDGVRAYWNAEKQVFLSRLGNVYPAPDWFTEGFPTDMDLDGELFGGRGRFQFTVGIAKTENSKHWDQLVYKVFDVPTLKKPFEDRMTHAEKLIEDMGSKYVEWVQHTKCKSLAHLDEVFDEVEKLGGEGLMIRESGSKYMGGRSSSLLKIKSFHDGEAEVIAHEDGKGKYTGMCGALRCKMASGKMFKVASGLSDEQREHPPAVGTIVVYKCQELTNDGIPRFPVFVGVAADKDRPTDPVIANAVGRDE